MGAVNKLLIVIDGKPMVRHAVEAALAAGLSPVFIVTGHQREEVEFALQDLPVTFLYNNEFSNGLATSLKRGVGSLPQDCDGVLVALGDMPLVKPAEIVRMVYAFNPVEGREIIVPVKRGKRGNPVLWGKRFWAEMRRLDGDVGARDLIAANPEAVTEIEMEGDGILTDIDTPQALAKLAGTSKIDA
jgi:molybdenum cofactor cytidylyltransferase